MSVEVRRGERFRFACFSSSGEFTVQIPESAYPEQRRNLIARELRRHHRASCRGKGKCRRAYVFALGPKKKKSGDFRDRIRKFGAVLASVKTRAASRWR